MKSLPHISLLLVAVILVISACDTAPQVEPSEGTQIEDAAALSKKGNQKVHVCHLTGEDDYRKITVGAPAARAHLKHGDEVAGGDVLDANCEPVPTATCPCYSAERLESGAYAGEPAALFADDEGERTLVFFELPDYEGPPNVFWTSTSFCFPDDNFSSVSISREEAEACRVVLSERADDCSGDYCGQSLLEE